MVISEAKPYVGTECEIVSYDRKGAEIREVALILDIQHIPMYGSSLITDCGEILLERVSDIFPYSNAAAA